MKTPLRFQITEYDCGTVSLENAIMYLFDREDISPEMIQQISMYTLDVFGSSGIEGTGGTSKEAIKHISNWINEYSENNSLDLKTNYLEKDKVNMDSIKKCIKNGGCVLLRTYQNCEHYVLITNIDEDYIYIWDSYYLEEEYYDEEKNIEIVFDEPFKYNRKVKLNRFDTLTKKDFSLGPISNRECVLFIRNGKK